MSSDGAKGRLLTKAAGFLEQKEPETALRKAQKALTIAKEAMDVRGEIEALCLLAEGRMAMRQSAKAANAALEAAGQSGKLKDRQVAATALTTIADILVRLQRPEDALLVAEQARVAFGECGDVVGQGALFVHTVCQAQMLRGDQDRALAAVEAALDLFRAAGLKAEEASALYTLARMRQEVGNREEGLLVAQDLVDAYAAQGNQAGQADALHMVAYMHLQLGEHQDALEKAEEARAAFRVQSDKRGEASVLETIVRVHMAQDKLEEALRSAEEARALSAAAGDAARAAQASQAIANIRIYRQEFREVLRDAKQAREGCRQQGDSHGEAQQWLAIADARLEQARVREPTVRQAIKRGRKAAGEAQATEMRRLMDALLAAKEALHLFQAVDATAGEAAALSSLAKVYRYKLEPKLAVEAARQAAMVCRSSGDHAGAANALVLEATSHLMRLEQPTPPAGETELEPRPPAPGKEALAAAEEACELFGFLQDKEGKDYAAKVAEAAREQLHSDDAAPRELPEDVLVLVDPAEKGPLEDMGFKFQDQALVLPLLRHDPRFPSPPGPSEGWSAKADPAMQRLDSAVRRARGIPIMA